MSLARVNAFALDGVEARRVWVEADIRRGLPAFTVVGLADIAVREARERVRAALVNSGYEFPLKRITVNLAPAYLRKIGPGFDLPVALAVLIASGQLAPGSLDGCAAAGELSLNGEVRAVRGALAIAEGLRRHGLARLVLPGSRACEAGLVAGIDVIGVTTLQEAVEVLRGDRAPALNGQVAPASAQHVEDEPDLSEVRGHNGLIPAIEVAAAGGHNLFLQGPPGTGKTMLARRLPTLLPPLSEHEAIEVTRLQSVAGLRGGGGLVTRRPFRAPHHTISAAGLVGGGSQPRPGETTLAHHGVLFLDELAEFGRPALEALRQPLEDGRVVIVRAQRAVSFPTRFMLVAASNPCPCGRGERSCGCSAVALGRHARKLSGPLMDRMDLMVAVGRPDAEALRTQAAPPSSELRSRIALARARQLRRLAGTGLTCNAQLTPRMLGELAAATTAAERALYELHDRDRLSARGFGRVLRVARTIADLDGSEQVERTHVNQAAALRLDRSRLMEVA